MAEKESAMQPEANVVRLPAVRHNESFTNSLEACGILASDL